MAATLLKWIWERKEKCTSDITDWSKTRVHGMTLSRLGLWVLCFSCNTLLRGVLAQCGARAEIPTLVTLLEMANPQHYIFTLGFSGWTKWKRNALNLMKYFKVVVWGFFPLAVDSASSPVLWTQMCLPLRGNEPHWSLWLPGKQDERVEAESETL